LYALTEDGVNERFGLGGREGATHEFLGCTRGVWGGGFVYTQTDTVSVGIVVHLDSLVARGTPPDELFEGFVTSPAVAHLLRGARLVEYSAHLLPEAGKKMVPRLSTAGLLVAGDAAGFCYTNGLTQEGMNLAMTSGLIAGRVGAAALRSGDVSSSGLARYGRELKKSAVIRDLSTWGRAIDLMHTDRLFTVYPRVVSTFMEEVFRSDGRPKSRLLKLGRRATKDSIPLRQLLTDMYKAGRAFVW
jgi:electron transfer flavoprotein-quinone oxidoreductase